jgi:hypothetical protein
MAAGCFSDVCISCSITQSNNQSLSHPIDYLWDSFASWFVYLSGMPGRLWSSTS